MKIWVPKQREVTVEVITKDNPDNDLKAGDLAVTMDGRTRIWSPDEFVERFEEQKIHEWPGYINVQSPDGRYDSGCVMVALESGSPKGLADALNKWAEAHENRGFVIKHLQTGCDPSPDASYFAIFMATTITTNKEREYLAKVHSRVSEGLEKEMAEQQKQEEDQLAKARELQAAAKVVEKAERRELERLAEVGKRHEANCGKNKGKGK